ncbi:MAG: ABC transporter ATP-binding protein, partial [Bacteroidota bacterium]|nr:ABC transporter ATP-binding protein [Bacteroidota bacterium]
YGGVLTFSAILAVVYMTGLATGYIQTLRMGGVGRRVLFKLRNEVFTKLQELPVAFFNQNKAGDLISRINNDTDKLNQFFSQALMQFIGSAFVILGAGIFLLSFNIRLGAAALLPALGVLIVTRSISAWVKRKNKKSLQAMGGMSAEIQESLENFKAIVAFNRLDYFRDKFNTANQINFSASVSSGMASNLFLPMYGLASSLAQLIVIAYGIYLISAGNITVGLLISFLLYVNNFYGPLRQIASVWQSLQLALASLDRISEVLDLESNMPVVPLKHTGNLSVLEFKDVFFHYIDGNDVLRNINFALEKGKTYALVGPTGGGKTTIASLMARLYDPSQGVVLLSGKDIRSYQPEERAGKIGFILQEPFLFTGTVRENILYSNERYIQFTDDQLKEELQKANLNGLLVRFEDGLETRVTSAGDSISLGQKQLIAFMRAVLRNPEILILDEATANIDTVTEQLLEEMLEKLPADTTRVVIAHRLNTIENADEIFFVNSGDMLPAGSFDHAVEMLLHGKRES